MKDWLIPVAAGAVAVAVCCFCYSIGYGRAQAECELEIERLKLEQAEEVIDAQNQVRMEYNEKIQALNADLASARDLNAERLRQLEAFRSSSGDLDSCARDRDELARLAVRGEQLLRDADAYLKALIEHTK